MAAIEVSDETYKQLVKLGGGLFGPSEVLARLVAKAAGTSGGHIETIPADNARHFRNPRERGVSVMVAGQRIDAVSVRDLFERVLKWLVDSGRIERMEPSIPLHTSSKRYLLARKPTHPEGNDFVVPVEYKGYSMEAHKNYENALSGLNLLAKVGGFDVKVIR